MSARTGPIRWDELAQAVLEDLWERTCRYRIKTGQPLPPEHLNPNRKAPR